MSRSSLEPRKTPHCSTSIIRSTWYVTTATKPSTWALPSPAEAGNETGSNSFSLMPLSVSLCCLQKREKRKEEEQRRKQWVDQEREKTLSRLRSFREVRLSHYICSLPTAAPIFVHKTSYPIVFHLRINAQALTTHPCHQRNLRRPHVLTMDRLSLCLRLECLIQMFHI